MVQPRAWLRLPLARGGHRGHLRPYGDASALRLRRRQAGRFAARAVRPGAERLDGGRGAAARRLEASLLALTSADRAAPKLTYSGPRQPAAASGERRSLTRNGGGRRRW